MADRVGQQLGNYRLVRLLGEGGFAEVYLGQHIYLLSSAAIKVLHTRLGQEDQNGFLSEARTIVPLKHPNIVRLLEFGIEGSTPYLVMDYAQGGTLRQRHPKGRQVPLATILPYVRQIADALQYAHEQKLIHRDIKPENMLLGEHGEVLLSDFGIATVAQTSRSQGTQDIAGTATYMAPEQLQGKPRPTSDQYALAVVVYEWLTGAGPFQGSFLEIASQHLLATPPPLREMVPSLPPAVEQVVLTALAKDPQARFPSIRAFATALEQAVQYNQPPQISAIPSSFPSASPTPTPVYSRPASADPFSTVPSTYQPPFGPSVPTPPAAQAVSANRWDARLSDSYTLPGASASYPTPEFPPAGVSRPPPKRRTWLILLSALGVIALLSGSLLWLGVACKGPLATVGTCSTTAGTPTPSTRGPTPVPVGTIREFPIPTPGSNPHGIAAGPDGNLWFTEETSNKIGRITLAGVIQEFSIPTPASTPSGITAGPDGALWFTEYDSNRIGRIAPSGSITEFPLPTPGSGPNGIVAGADGNLWFTEWQADAIGRITPTGAVNEYTISTAGSNPNVIAAGPDGSLWFTEYTGNHLGRITLSGIITEFQLQTDSSGLVGISAGPDGNLWFAESFANQIGRINSVGKINEFPLPVPGSHPYNITAGPDGNLWFTEKDGGNRIGRISSSGTITEFPVPTPNSLPFRIITGPDGNLWFTEYASNQIGRITSGK